MTTTKLTGQKLEEMVNDPSCIKVVNALFEAVAYCECVRSIIEPKQQEVIDFYKFKVRDDTPSGLKRGITTIESQKHMYLASDEDFNIYMREMDKFHTEQGFTKDNWEQCPLLIAESLVRKIKIQVCDFLEPYLGMNYDQISGSLDRYKKYFDLIMTMFADKVKEYQEKNKQ